MNVLILGCGRVGAWLATELSTSGHRVRILDPDEENFRRLPAELRTSEPDGGLSVAVVGDGTQQEDLVRAGIEEAELFVAAMERDTPNLLAAQIALRIFQVPHVVCRLNDPGRQQVYEQLGLKVVNATELVATSMLRAIGEL